MTTPMISTRDRLAEARVSPVRLTGTSAKSAELLRVPWWKRCLDVSLIAISAPVWLPVMAFLSAMIKLLSPGPVLFKQERIGLGGNRFVCLKFRTMHDGAATGGHEQYLAELMKSNRPMTKLDGNDPRLIPLAWVVRSTGLDELPQLFNVLRGEMSLVGPRPCTRNEYESYTEPQRARLGATPGLTGLWQVSGKNHTTFEEMIELDIRYMRTQCVWLDVGIMLRTPLVLVQQLAESVLCRSRDGGPSACQSRLEPEHCTETSGETVRLDVRTSSADGVAEEPRASCRNPQQGPEKLRRRPERRPVAGA